MARARDAHDTTPPVTEPVHADTVRADTVHADTVRLEGDRRVDDDRVDSGRTAAAPVADGRAVYERERAQYGGIKFGSAFFGWLTATGLTVMLSAIAAAILGSIGVQTGVDTVEEVDFGAALTAAIVLLVILFVSYLAGGYVAGRMARFAGVKQGLAVWIWGVVITLVLIVVGAIAGTQFDVLSQVGVLPDLRFGDETVVGSVITIAATAVVTLLGAILGGVLGMRFHRRVDRAGWAEQRDL